MYAVQYYIQVEQHANSAVLAPNFHRDHVALQNDVLEYIRKHASKSGEDMRKEIPGA